LQTAKKERKCAEYHGPLSKSKGEMSRRTPIWVMGKGGDRSGLFARNPFNDHRHLRDRAQKGAKLANSTIRRPTWIPACAILSGDQSVLQEERGGSHEKGREHPKRDK